MLRVTQKRGGYQKLDKLFFFSLDGNTTTLAEIAIRMVKNAFIIPLFKGVRTLEEIEMLNYPVLIKIQLFIKWHSY